MCSVTQWKVNFLHGHWVAHSGVDSEKVHDVWPDGYATGTRQYMLYVCK